ncbi:hypothetical protein WICPIJ_008543 [Wickerhamomyces pijperi]|uniref:Uncharacterized protein n=1 Tax=Wickerhamomyces pijperi TaxID=599730 RepID=A0A9P8PYS0_WICPI|nr:hypothetical protein WICPIJ_008543 [Wickerhamomyces pijperi]
MKIPFLEPSSKGSNKSLRPMNVWSKLLTLINPKAVSNCMCGGLSPSMMVEQMAMDFPGGQALCSAPIKAM